MIDNFEDYTAVLTDYERDEIVPALSDYLKARVGSKNAIRNKELCRILTDKGVQGLNEARVRKCINYIRRKGLVQHLIANSKGYFVATSIEQEERYIRSLRQRQHAIEAVADVLSDGLSGLLFIA